MHLFNIYEKYRKNRHAVVCIVYYVLGVKITKLVVLYINLCCCIGNNQNGFVLDGTNRLLPMVLQQEEQHGNNTMVVQMDSHGFSFGLNALKVWLSC